MIAWSWLRQINVVWQSRSWMLVVYTLGCELKNHRDAWKKVQWRWASEHSVRCDWARSELHVSNVPICNGIWWEDCTGVSCMLHHQGCSQMTRRNELIAHVLAAGIKFEDVWWKSIQSELSQMYRLIGKHSLACCSRTSTTTWQVRLIDRKEEKESQWNSVAVGNMNRQSYVPLEWM